MKSGTPDGRVPRPPLKDESDGTRTCELRRDGLRHDGGCRAVRLIARFREQFQRAIALWTELTVVSRSLTTAAIDTFISDVSTTSTNVAAASTSESREVPAPAG
jgi:hypothetical protein